MLQAYLGDKMVCGITRGNVTKLVDEKQPMVIRLAKSVSEVMVIFGETKPDILRQLEEAGAEIPDALKRSAEEAPL